MLLRTGGDPAAVLVLELVLVLLERFVFPLRNIAMMLDPMMSRRTVVVVTTTKVESRMKVLLCDENSEKDICIQPGRVERKQKRLHNETRSI